MTTVLPRRADAARNPWLLWVDGTMLIIRGAVPRDLPAVAIMHSRCSAKALLDRYRNGGRPPAVVELDRQLRDALTFVVTAEDGRVVAVSRAVADPDHRVGSAEISVLVEDAWQRMGIGRRLLRHTAAAASLAGYRQLVAYPGTTGAVAGRLLAGIGTTRVVADPQRHLHTTLADTARRGLGSVQPALAEVLAASITG